MKNICVSTVSGPPPGKSTKAFTYLRSPLFWIGCPRLLPACQSVASSVRLHRLLGDRHAPGSVRLHCMQRLRPCIAIDLAPYVRRHCQRCIPYWGLPDMCGQGWDRLRARDRPQGRERHRHHRRQLGTLTQSVGSIRRTASGQVAVAQPWSSIALSRGQDWLREDRSLAFESVCGRALGHISAGAPASEEQGLRADGSPASEEPSYISNSIELLMRQVRFGIRGIGSNR